MTASDTGSPMTALQERSGPGSILPLAARRGPEHIALITGDGVFTFAELEDLSSRCARALRDQGFGPGQVMSLYGPNSWQWIVAYHGALRAGLVVNPVNSMLTVPEVEHVLTDCRSVAVLAGGSLADQLRASVGSRPGCRVLDLAGGRFEDLLKGPRLVEEAEVDPDAVCTIGYTSGTTGHPKGAMQTHRAVLLNCALTATMHGRTASDTVVTALPAPHVYGNVVVNGTFLAGGTVVLLERFDPEEVLRTIGRHRATMFEGVPAMYAMLLASPHLPTTDLESLRVCTAGGQTLPLAVSRAWQDRSGARLLELWGMTELAGLGTTHALHAPPCPGSIGVALPGIQIRITDPDDPTRETAAGVPGELRVRGPLVMTGYFGNPDATNAVSDDGWLRTGDIAYADETGHLFIVDRLADLIITAGYNVYPAEIERVLAEHPAVALVGVGPVPDDVKGELACAYVVLRPGHAPTEKELIAYTRDGLAAYKRPRAVRFLAALPTTSSGKIMRRRLAAAWEAAAGAG